MRDLAARAVWDAIPQAFQGAIGQAVQGAIGQAVQGAAAQASPIAIVSVQDAFLQTHQSAVVQDAIGQALQNAAEGAVVQDAISHAPQNAAVQDNVDVHGALVLALQDAVVKDAIGQAAQDAIAPVRTSDVTTGEVTEAHLDARDGQEMHLLTFLDTLGVVVSQPTLQSGVLKLKDLLTSSAEKLVESGIPEVTRYHAKTEKEIILGEETQWLVSGRILKVCIKVKYVDEDRK